MTNGGLQQNEDIWKSWTRAMISILMVYKTLSTEEQQELLYPGLCQALYAFGSEGTAKIKIGLRELSVELVGGVGRAVVDERGSSNIRLYLGSC